MGGVVPPDARHLLLLGDLLRWHWRRYFRDKEEEENRGVHGTSGLPRASGALPSAGATTNHDDGADGDLRKPCAHGDCTGADWDGASANGNHDCASRHVHGSRRTARLLSSRLCSTLGEFRMSESDHAPSRRFGETINKGAWQRSLPKIK